MVPAVSEESEGKVELAESVEPRSREPSALRVVDTVPSGAMEDMAVVAVAPAVERVTDCSSMVVEVLTSHPTVP